ncbi:uncharacterized protein F4822DRAFT_147722 [Hypoxylon trugodes]|uniref:uncharacterized protein n=1 Tax=Hypoxylon trugodes TaxID=326681 RepID=UPI00219990B5|nr:uncharacterized protein F4822DRAFT_147722 [Hypoxylon trugodes]KAI1392992.1 hypothetical protein F4822DRAFT_147722 [Hypoxylon trugodes]
MDRRARFSCVACRRLKRKCPKELPSCSLCLRLEKRCQYPPRARNQPEDVNEDVNLQAVSTTTGELSLRSRGSIPEAPESINTFPALFFLDSGICTKPLFADFNQRRGPPALFDNVSTEKLEVCETYFSTIHQWLPILSRKCIRRHMIEHELAQLPQYDLLFLSMELVSRPLLPGTIARENKMYLNVLQALLQVENSCLPSPQLLQSLILIATYEIGHAIYPAAYLRVGYASRLCIMIGLHDRKNAAQLFKDTPTWTAREEERRAWWAVFCLDRMTNQGIKGLPLSAPEPSPGELMPSPEAPWDEGGIGFNEPLFATSFSNNTSLGSFANVCQAGHILGRVLRHRDEVNSSNISLGFRATEARQLHHILASLYSHLDDVSKDSTCLGGSPSTSIALCFSARLILYDLYACNEKYSTDHGRSSEEAEMQREAISGIFDVVRCTWKLARQLLDSIQQGGGSNHDSANPLLCHCLYEAAGECEWLILEQQDPSAITWIKDIVELLEVIGKRWQAAGVYLSEIYKWPGYSGLVK